MEYTSTAFVSAVKRLAAMPTDQDTFTTEKFLEIGDEQILSYILPGLAQKLEQYYAYDVEESVNATGVYEIPSRAVGGALLNVALLDGTSRHDVSWISEDQLDRTDESLTGKPGCYIKRNQLILVPPTSHGYDTLRKTILIRPNSLIQTSSAAQITAINTGTGTLTFASLPSTFTTARSYDFIQQNPHFDHVEIDKSATTITSTTMVFASLSSRLAVGDWVAIAGQSPIVQVPVELQVLLRYKAAQSCLMSQGDTEHYKTITKDIELMEKGLTSIFTPRIKQEGKKIINRSPLLRRV